MHQTANNSFSYFELVKASDLFIFYVCKMWLGPFSNYITKKQPPQRAGQYKRVCNINIVCFCYIVSVCVAFECSPSSACCRCCPFGCSYSPTHAYFSQGTWKHAKKLSFVLFSDGKHTHTQTTKNLFGYNGGISAHNINYVLISIRASDVFSLRKYAYIFMTFACGVLFINWLAA